MVTTFQKNLFKNAQIPASARYAGATPQDWSVPVPAAALLATTGAGALMSDDTGLGQLDYARGAGKGLATGAGALLGHLLGHKINDMTAGNSIWPYLMSVLGGGAAGYGLSDLLLGGVRGKKEEDVAEPEMEKTSAVDYFSGVMKNTDTVPLQPGAGPRGGVRIIDQLRQAKVESDRRNWQAKHRILRSLLMKRPTEFWIDSDEGEILGITHRSGFKFHLPRRVVPTNITFKTPVTPLREKIAEYAVKTLQKVSTLRQSSNRPAVLYDPDADVVHDADTPPDGLGERPWVVIKQAAWTIKDIWDPLLKLWHVKGTPFTSLYGGGTPLAATVAGGLLGAGGGYLGGKLLRRFLPDKYFDEEGLPRTMAVLGGLMGAAPGFVRGTTLASRPDQGWSSWVAPDPLFNERSASTKFIKDARLAGGYFDSVIPVDSFNRVIWQDPLSSVPLRSGASGLIEGASQLRGGSSFVSPSDVANIAVGAGTGLMSGTVIGRVMGALAGLRPEAQEFLQQTGMWSGILRSALPSFLGG